MRSKFLIMLIPLFFACSNYKEEIVVVMKNNSPLERKNELITIPRAVLEKQMGKIRDDEQLILAWQVVVLPAQFDDLNKDGKWDELAFLGEFLPLENIHILIKRIKDKRLTNFMTRTNIRFARAIKPGIEYEEADSAYRLKGYMLDSTIHYPQFEGPGWENDIVAFRNYFDERNGIDIFGKAVSSMILDSVGINNDYHVPQYWGMDILKVGNSLGAGSLGILYKDSLYRVSAIEGASFRKIAEGPIRSILDFDFKQLQINDRTIGLKHRVSIVVGEYGYRSDVTLYGAPEDMILVAGIVNLQSDTLYADTTNHINILYTHDKQTMNGEYLGMGLITRSEDYAGWFETPKEGDGITNTYAVKMKIEKNRETSFRFFAGWDVTQPYFSDRLGFSKYLSHEATKFSTPIIVSFQ